MAIDLWSLGITAVERGSVPDFLLSQGIRRLLANRIRTEARRDCAARQAEWERFFAESCAGPLALVPEKANEQHYEVPAEFYERALGPHRKYSCCYYERGTESLAEAEAAALRITCDRAELHDGQQILELGCGWGSLSLFMAENFPRATITAVSNSHSQRQFIEAEAVKRQLANLRVVTADMNDFTPAKIAGEPLLFDRVVSVEMFEHMRNHQELLRRIAIWLKPCGKLFAHIFCHSDQAYPFETDGAVNWMGRYFFTGGMMPSENWLARCQRDLRLMKQWRWNGRHYGRTCRDWLRNFDARRTEILPILARTYGPAAAFPWLMRWRIFFIACAELFEFHDGNEWYIGHYLFEKPV